MSTARAPNDPATILDAHVHFWDPTALQYPWLDAFPALRHSFSPADYSKAVETLPVERYLLVEGNCLPEQNLREVQYFTELGGSDPRIGGIIAFVELTKPEILAATLDCLTSRSLVKGIRQNIQGQPSGFALQRAFVEGVREVGARGWTFDLCVTHDQLGEAIALVERCPDTSFVLDHCAKPSIRTAARDPWRQELARLAAHENVCCKISGLLTEADLAHWTDKDLLPYGMHAIECFGIDRILYGSDWPVLTLAGSYASWYGFTARLTESFTEHERRRFYGENAARVYRVELPRT